MPDCFPTLRIWPNYARCGSTEDPMADGRYYQARPSNYSPHPKAQPAAEDSSPTAAEATPATYGHLGFTGTCFWVDPDNRIIYIFLCNRVNPTRDNPAFSRLNIRPALLSAIYRSL